MNWRASSSAQTCGCGNLDSLVRGRGVRTIIDVNWVEAVKRAKCALGAALLLPILQSCSAASSDDVSVQITNCEIGPDGGPVANLRLHNNGDSLADSYYVEVGFYDGNLQVVTGNDIESVPAGTDVVAEVRDAVLPSGYTPTHDNFPTCKIVKQG